LPPVTQALIGLNIIGFAVQQLLGPWVIMTFALWPPIPVTPEDAMQFQVWQPVTYAFLHGNLAHLMFNMLGFWMLGRDVEEVFGSVRYLQYYFTCVITAALAQMLVVALLDQPPAPTVGASGGVFGLLLAYGMLFPRRRLMLLFPPIPMPAWLFVTFYGLIELGLGLSGSQTSVAHFAHLGGMAGGLLLILWWRHQARQGR